MTLAYGEVHMSVLVDAARWRWRGAVWCHLVSDRDLGEIHEFAAELGCRRVGFQGDHYDIDSVSRDEAIALGAIECDSRDLVRRLRAAGLRARPKSFTKWSLVASGVGPLVGEQITDTLPLERVAPIFDPAFAALRDQADGWFHLARPNGVALVAHGTAPGLVGPKGAIAVGDTSREDGIFVRLDGRGTWSVECIDPPPTDRE